MNHPSFSTAISAVEIHGTCPMHPNTINFIQLLQCHIVDYNAEKHRQLHIILAIIVFVFSACVIILMGIVTDY